MAMEWIENVDVEKKIYPKLPITLRSQLHNFEQSKKIEKATELNKDAMAAVDKALKESTEQFLSGKKLNSDMVDDDDSDDDGGDSKKKDSNLFPDAQIRSEGIPTVPTNESDDVKQFTNIFGQVLTKKKPTIKKKPGTRGPDTKKRKKRKCTQCDKSKCPGSNGGKCSERVSFIRNCRKFFNLFNKQLLKSHS